MVMGQRFYNQVQIKTNEVKLLNRFQMMTLFEI